MDLILHREYRLPDGTFARHRPQNNTVWLDDMFMGVPAIAWYGKLTGEKKYFDEEGKVNGTCVGTGMAFDPAVFAGAEIIRLVENFHPRMNDSAVQFYREDYSDKGPIFSVNVK